ncbi:IS481-like element ISMsm9 family transposase [soil metagenome]
MHANAPLTPTGRLILCERIDRGRPIAHVAREMGISRATASKWWHRYCETGENGLLDRRSIPHSSPSRLSERTERRIIGLRVNRRWGPAQIGGHLGLNPSTVWRVLHRYGISRLKNLDPSSGRTIRRYEKKTPGELVHVDVKKFAKIPNGGGWRSRGRGHAGPRQNLGYSYLHSMVDDHTRLAYSEFCPDETAPTSLRFTQRAVQWFADRSVTVTAIMTDNGSAYRSRLYSHTLEGVGIGHLLTRPYRPQTNGKVEREDVPSAVEVAAGGPQTPSEPTTSPAGLWIVDSCRHHASCSRFGVPIREKGRKSPHLRRSPR